VQRNFNFPEGFLDMTLIYPHVEYKLEHDFGDFKMLGYIDNMSKDYELVVDFKTGTAPWSTQRLQQSLQMQTYSLILWYKFGVMPTSVISYWKTKLRGKTLSWAGEHESFMYVFNTEELTAAEARIRKAAKEISEAYERYNSSYIGELMAKYAEIKKELKALDFNKDTIKNQLTLFIKR
jgi:RecB family exonuclease